MRPSSIICLILFSTLMLYGCAIFWSEPSEWDSINYSELSCGNDHTSPNCKPHGDDSISNVSKGGGKR